MEINRKSGVLLHLSSLPGAFGIGDMGPGAESFLDFLSAAGFRAWQILPLSLTNAVFGDSPYSSPSSFAGNTLLISPELLVEAGLLEEAECAPFYTSGGNQVDFEQVRRSKEALLGLAYRRFSHDTSQFEEMHEEFWDFSITESAWLDDYALFMILKEEFNGACWNQWPEAYRTRDSRTLLTFTREPEPLEKMNRVRFEQFLFFMQLKRLRELCDRYKIELIGDLPIYVGFDSADVWSRQDLFYLDDMGNPITVTGVPPDYFSATGQRWGNPVYRWDVMRSESFDWWLRRFKQALRGCDLLRVDHFRGFCGYWEIPAADETAINGWWAPGPGKSFFDAFHGSFVSERGIFPFIAEDLGVITPDVKELMEIFDFPGMKILQFAFGEGMEENPYIPHQHRRNSVVYTGTHDNNTTLGWWQEDAGETERRNFVRYMGRTMVTDDEVLSLMVRAALGSVAEMAIIPMQDVLSLGAAARMNRPSVSMGNWRWRCETEHLTPQRAAYYRDLNTLYGRSR